LGDRGEEFADGAARRIALPARSEGSAAAADDDDALSARRRPTLASLNRVAGPGHLLQHATVTSQIFHGRFAEVTRQTAH